MAGYMHGRYIARDEVASFTRGNDPHIPSICYHVTSEQGWHSLLRDGISYDFDNSRIAEQGYGFYMTPRPFVPYMLDIDNVVIACAVRMRNPLVIAYDDVYKRKAQLWAMERDRLHKLYPDRMPHQLPLSEYSPPAKLFTDEVKRQGYDGVYTPGYGDSQYSQPFIIAIRPGSVRFIEGGIEHDQAASMYHTNGERKEA